VLATGSGDNDDITLLGAAWGRAGGSRLLSGHDGVEALSLILGMAVRHGTSGSDGKVINSEAILGTEALDLSTVTVQQLVVDNVTAVDSVVQTNDVVGASHSIQELEHLRGGIWSEALSHILVGGHKLVSLVLGDEVVDLLREVDLNIRVSTSLGPSVGSGLRSSLGALARRVPAAILILGDLQRVTLHIDSGAKGVGLNGVLVALNKVEADAVSSADGVVELDKGARLVLETEEELADLTKGISGEALSHTHVVLLQLNLL